MIRADMEHEQWKRNERALKRRILALEAALANVLNHCDTRPIGETVFERHVIAARRLLRLAPPQEAGK